MVQTRKERKAADIKLAHPDRSGPSEETLVKLAEDRNLFKQAEQHKGKQLDEIDDEEPLSPRAERIMDAILWSVSLSMLHFTLDVLVQHQYAVSIEWPRIVIRTMQACAVFTLLIYVLHPHQAFPRFCPGLPLRYQDPLRQTIFFVASICSGCYLIHISNKYSYLAVMKQSPPLGCIWVWSVIELNLPLAVLSLAVAGGFFVQGGYTMKAPY
ncbi:uncharacterized protein F4807DRAFT_463519 [Annulohypoxylon truncatum]|uniref:uncharacterized protein n=1 Tax=Annulohypoxylon truncatum TaxID=327061 RepID=UPI00200790E7|nr:uncharacterized protein F4807DRAFT_463519 [Annulohypoxylon truncatum]KAI1206573.1 hypothetical protein F4807DRAFT_463519 [Annulohypoxylon truncatum]